MYSCGIPSPCTPGAAGFGYQHHVLNELSTLILATNFSLCVGVSRAARAQAPFTVAGAQRCGSGTGERPPWWVPVSVVTASKPAKPAWHVVEHCGPMSIAVLEVRLLRSHALPICCLVTPL